MDEEEEEYGVIKPDGSINWKCPCLGTYMDTPSWTGVSCRRYGGRSVWGGIPQSLQLFPLQ